MKRNSNLLLLALGVQLTALAQEPLTPVPTDIDMSRGAEAIAGHEDYVQRYKDIAIAEMQRVGIPASIKLGQAVLESSGGKSELAIKANNHFGIKCGGNWSGKTMNRIDDERHADGALKESCFRKYDDPADSFFDHSDIICNPKKTYLYGGLFALDKSDYRAWARGLQTAGYATDPGYANKLIAVIERNQLYLYDEQVLAGKVDPPAKPKPSKEKTKPAPSPSTPIAVNAMSRIVRKNDVKLVLAVEGETIDEIARAFNVKVDRVLDYNESYYVPGKALSQNTKIYIQKKRSKWRGRAKQHFVRNNQTMFEIAQEYGIQLEKLLDRNLLQAGDEPMEGERISLKGKPKPDRKIRLRNSRPGENLVGEELFVIGEPTQVKPIEERPAVVVTTPTPVPVLPVTEKPTTTPNKRIVPDPTTPVVVTPPTLPDTTSNYHTVAKGDTLFNLSKRYSITIASLKAMNGLSGDSIQIGQRLRIK